MASCSTWWNYYDMAAAVREKNECAARVLTRNAGEWIWLVWAQLSLARHLSSCARILYAMVDNDDGSKLYLRNVVRNFSFSFGYNFHRMLVQCVSIKSEPYTFDALVVVHLNSTTLLFCLFLSFDVCRSHGISVSSTSKIFYMNA